MNQDRIATEGVVAEALPNTMFRVKLPDERILLCTLSGKMNEPY